MESISATGNLLTASSRSSSMVSSTLSLPMAPSLSVAINVIICSPIDNSPDTSNSLPVPNFPSTSLLQTKRSSSSTSSSGSSADPFKIISAEFSKLKPSFKESICTDGDLLLESSRSSVMVILTVSRPIAPSLSVAVKIIW